MLVVPFLKFSPPLVRPERPQSAEARGRRAHTGHRALPGGEAAVARPALHAAPPLQAALL